MLHEGWGDVRVRVIRPTTQSRRLRYGFPHRCRASCRGWCDGGSERHWASLCVPLGLPGPQAWGTRTAVPPPLVIVRRRGFTLPM